MRGVHVQVVEVGAQRRQRRPDLMRGVAHEASQGAHRLFHLVGHPVVRAGETADLPIPRRVRAGRQVALRHALSGLLEGHDRAGDPRADAVAGDRGCEHGDRGCRDPCENDSAHDVGALGGRLGDAQGDGTVGSASGESGLEDLAGAGLRRGGAGRRRLSASGRGSERIGCERLRRTGVGDDRAAGVQQLDASLQPVGGHAHRLIQRATVRRAREHVAGRLRRRLAQVVRLSLREVHLEHGQQHCAQDEGGQEGDAGVRQGEPPAKRAWPAVLLSCRAHVASR